MDSSSFFSFAFSSSSEDSEDGKSHPRDPHQQLLFWSFSILSELSPLKRSNEDMEKAIKRLNHMGGDDWLRSFKKEANGY